MGPRQYAPINYSAPPIVEVAMSVQFDPPKGLNAAHLGAFWANCREEFPNVRSLSPIYKVDEAFGGPDSWPPPSLRFALTSEPDCRLQMTSLDDQWMCQAQRNRLVVNWRKRGAEYPRFEATWDRFQKSWSAWLVFLRDVGLAEVEPRLWELVYVNRIPQGTLWEKPSDWPKVFPGLWGGDFATIPEVELSGFQGQWVWESHDPPARLYVEPGRTGDPPQEILVLSLTARGRIGSLGAGVSAEGGAMMQAIESGMDCGHRLIVTTFDGIASAAAKKEWGVV